MFYMEDYLTVKTGEEIFGTIGMRPNAKNNVRRWEYLGGISACSVVLEALSSKPAGRPSYTTICLCLFGALGSVYMAWFY